MCLQNNVLRRKSISYVILNKFKQVSFHKSVKVFTSAKAFMGIANGIIKSISKLHQRIFYVIVFKVFTNGKEFNYGLFTKIPRINNSLNFAEFIQTQKGHRTSLDKVTLLT